MYSGKLSLSFIKKSTSYGRFAAPDGPVIATITPLFFRLSFFICNSVYIINHIHSPRMIPNYIIVIKERIIIGLDIFNSF